MKRFAILAVLASLPAHAQPSQNVCGRFVDLGPDTVIIGGKLTGSAICVRSRVVLQDSDLDGSAIYVPQSTTHATVRNINLGAGCIITRMQARQCEAPE